MINKEDIFIGQLVDFETILYRVVEIKENSAIVKPIYHDWELEEAQFSELYPVNELTLYRIPTITKITNPTTLMFAGLVIFREITYNNILLFMITSEVTDLLI